MNPSFYHCTILRYRPSYLLGEVANIGVLFWFLDEGKFVFVYPPRLERLQHLYFETNLQTIRRYLKAFEQQANRLTKDLDLLAHHFDPNILSEYFLVEDANSFFFSEWKKGITAGDTIDVIVQRDSQKYLHYYYKGAATAPHDEVFLRNQFRQALSVAAPEKRAFFKEKQLIIAKRVQHEFPYAWQNGTLNVVAPLSFDLQEAQSIQAKATRWFGLFYHLQETAEAQNLKFDVLLAAPSNKNLLPCYDDALGILQDINGLDGRLSFHNEESISEYVAYAADNVITF
jgi:hypothetical protein